jgi:hypothetical protein
MSTTSDLEVALRYAVDLSTSGSVLLLRLRTSSFMERGADLTFVSAFPGEAEVLYPPLTYLQVKNSPRKHMLPNGIEVTVIDTVPHFGSS